MQTTITRSSGAPAPRSAPSTRRARGLRAGLVAVAGATALALGGCASPEPIELGADTVVVDVRTPAEYAAGHLDGAVNLDLTSGELAAEIPALDAEGDYVVYCKSGNRSAQAASLMEDAGLDVTDAGSMQQAADATGLPIVQ
ncbi:rhodanese-like domain-containing protein [Agromyces kandeliae]|uniref:Rhodanese-like domain-containing protein n=1 Tax=Agromyces kandeliae TaxID=2666141 RepID=A0A6L5R0F5_9MICO|nr:rhodanese-like domain-containing protein [Agromyces kandeliae]MRX43439.1 rhodanese-like domain-containing protein [Agromyces kandeliae]